jgi:cyanophycin synthetase
MKILKVQALATKHLERPKKKVDPDAPRPREMEQFPTNKIEGFRERIEAMFPP